MPAPNGEGGLAVNYLHGNLPVVVVVVYVAVPDAAAEIRS